MVGVPRGEGFVLGTPAPGHAAFSGCPAYPWGRRTSPRQHICGAGVSPLPLLTSGLRVCLKGLFKRCLLVQQHPPNPRHAVVKSSFCACQKYNSSSAAEHVGGCLGQQGLWGARWPRQDFGAALSHIMGWGVRSPPRLTAAQTPHPG